jgi:hypothetical protein
MVKPRIVIIGAGLGGCFVAHALAESHDVTVIELGSTAPGLQERVRDRAMPAVLNPHIQSGLGGTTALWHNGLIEVDERIFRDSWPFPKADLAPYYAEAYPLLGGVPAEVVERACDSLRQKYRELGLPPLSLPGLFYPRSRINAWNSLKLEGRVRLVMGEVLALEAKHENRIRGALVRTIAGSHQIDADAFVLAAGGLSTPLLLQQLATNLPLPALKHAGCHYEDHPMAFVGDFKMRAPLYRYWNFSVPDADGNIRLPLVVEQEGLHVSFHIRPAAVFHHGARREEVHSVLTDIRNNRLNPMGYLRLLTHTDDILDILSFKFNIQVPTKHYSLLMYAQQPTSAERGVWSEVDPVSGESIIQRNWDLTPDYLAILDRAIGQVVDHLGDMVTNVNLFAGWKSNVHTAAHHSGTARMAASPADGVCDADARVHGLQNLYIADGSVIPGSGIANTGLTIAALALRVAKHLQVTVPAESF